MAKCPGIPVAEIACRKPRNSPCRGYHVHEIVETNGSRQNNFVSSERVKRGSMVSADAVDRCTEMSASLHV